MYKIREDGGKRRGPHKPPIFTKHWSSNHGGMIIDNIAIYLVIALGHTFSGVLSKGYVICFNSLTDSMK